MAPNLLRSLALTVPGSTRFDVKKRPEIVKHLLDAHQQGPNGSLRLPAAGRVAVPWYKRIRTVSGNQDTVRYANMMKENAQLKAEIARLKAEVHVKAPACSGNEACWFEEKAGGHWSGA